jgi:CBS-domain-containing membrane protein
LFAPQISRERERGAGDLGLPPIVIWHTVWLTERDRFMSTTLRIADIMTREVLTLPPDMAAAEAALALAEHGVSGAPVREADGRIVGILSRSDLTDPERQPGKAAPTVRDLMTPGLLTLRESDLAMNAVRLMVREEIHRIVVLDADGELAGIVTRSDVMRALVAGDPLDESDDRGPSGPVTIH